MVKLRRVALAVAALMTVCAVAQSSVQVSGLLTPVDLGLIESLKAMSWPLAFGGDEPKYKLVSGDEIANGYLVGIAYGNFEAAEREAAHRFQAELVQSVRQITSVGGYPAGFLMPDLGPVRFFNQGGELGVLISGVGIGMEFNSFNTTALSRAKRVVYEVLVPLISRVAGPFSESEVRWVGISMSYGAQDFTEDIDLPFPELTMVLFPTSSAAEYADFQITDTELVSRSLAFAGRPSELRRVDLDR